MDLRTGEFALSSAYMLPRSPRSASQQLPRLFLMRKCVGLKSTPLATQDFKGRRSDCRSCTASFRMAALTRRN